jgi:hypothetical protein
MATNSSLPDPAASSNSSLYKGTDNNVSRIIKVDTSTGCTLTNASIKGLTPSEFEALSNKEVDLARVIASSAEAKMLGVQERGFTTLLNSSVQNIKPLLNKVNVAEQSIILPYIQRRQRHVINANYFTIEAGGSVPTSANSEFYLASDGQASGYEYAGQDQHVTVNLGGSDWASPVDKIERYFLPGGYVVVNWWNESGGKQVAVEVQFKIVGCKSADADGITKARITLRPQGAEVKPVYANKAAFDTETFAGQYKPTLGMLQTVANNVSDYEEWCRNQPTDLSVKLIVNWLQTTRESRTVDQTYKETLQKIMSGKVNPYLSSMVYQPLAEQNKIAAQVSQDQWTRAVWFNQALSTKQRPETYMELPAISDPENNNCTLEYKCNAVGIKQLLRESLRVFDNKGEALDLESLFSHLYFLKRNREQDGTSVSVIDVMTDRFTYNLFYECMNNYYKKRYGWEIQRNAELNQTITQDGIILFNYSKYDIPEVGVQLAVFHDPFFDDYANVGTGNKYLATGARSASKVFGSGANEAIWENQSRMMWFIDWSDVKIGIAGTNAVTRTSPHPDVQKEYKCRMAHKETEYSLRSTTWTTMMDVPSRHLIIENFSLDINSDVVKDGGSLKSTE